MSTLQTPGARYSIDVTKTNNGGNHNGQIRVVIEVQVAAEGSEANIDRITQLVVDGLNSGAIINAVTTCITSQEQE